MMTLSVADARASLSKIVEAAHATHERFEVTRNGSRVAVLLGADDFDALVETVAILGDQPLVRSIMQTLAEVESGQTVSTDDVSDAMRNAGRLPD